MMDGRPRSIALRESGINHQALASPLVILNKSLFPSPDELWADMEVVELDQVNGWFWMVGSKDNVNTLHHQRVLLRQIIPTDNARLHLVWFGRTIYIKPLPDCLLDQDYIDKYVQQPNSNASYNEERESISYLNRDEAIRRTTAGFLKTYCDLIRTSADIKVAHELGLLSREFDWPTWFRHRSKFLIEFKANGSHTTRLYQSGELRLSRLNVVWRFTGQGWVYFTVHREYDTYFQQYFSLFIAAFAIVATVLTAMQVLVGMDGIPGPVRQVSYWFGITAIIIILACLVPLLTLFLAMVLSGVGTALWKKIRGERGKFEDLEAGDVRPEKSK